MLRAFLTMVFVLAWCAGPAHAMQNLIPAPFPNAAPGATPLDPVGPEAGGPQRLIRDPYPQVLGDDGQGNPPIARALRHQRPVPTIRQRKYRVDH